MTDLQIVQVGKRIRGLRKASELSQEALAAKAGLDRSYMGQVERGEKNITLKTVFKISAALGVHPSEILR